MTQNRSLREVGWVTSDQVLLDDGNRIIIPQGNFKVLCPIMPTAPEYLCDFVAG